MLNQNRIFGSDISLYEQYIGNETWDALIYTYLQSMGDFSVDSYYLGDNP